MHLHFTYSIEKILFIVWEIRYLHAYHDIVHYITYLVILTNIHEEEEDLHFLGRLFLIITPGRQDVYLPGKLLTR